jgi:glycosyltransferase involved in cell wall biosynthesis
MRRVAIFLPGGLGLPHSGIHIPTLHALVERLSAHFEIIAYSHRLPDKKPSVTYCGNATVRFLDVTYQSHSFVRAASFVRAFLEDHRKKNFDLLHGMWGLPFGLYAVVLGRLFGIPAVVSLHGRETASLPDIDYGDLRKQPQRSLLLWVSKNASRLILQSKLQEKALRENGLTRRDVQIIPQGVDTGQFETARNGTVQKPYRFVSIGDLRDVKDPMTLLRSFSLTVKKVDARLRIIGTDHYRDRLTNAVRDLGIADKVEFLGYVSYDQIQQHLKWADVLLHTSRHEGGGAVIMEAAAAGAVVCGTRVGMLHDLEQQQMAIAVDVGDHTSLAARVISLLEHPSAMDTLRKRARGWAVAHDINWTTNQMIQSYNEVLEK